MPPGGSTNVDDLVKKIDAQIAKLEEEERLEKEKLANGDKTPQSKENEFEKLVNKKYEDFKMGEEKMANPNPPINPQPNVQSINNPVVPGPQLNQPIREMPPINNNVFENPMANQLGMGAPMNVDDLIKKIDAKIAQLEKEEEEERQKALNSSNQVLPKQPDVLEKVDFPNPFNGNNKVTDVSHTERDNNVQEGDSVGDLFKTIEKMRVEEEKQLNKIEEISKPQINIDVDSIVSNDSVSDDEFFDDFFGDDDF